MSRIKYPSTLYLPFSLSSDNKDFIQTELFVGKPLVITIKMDGSNCSLTRDRVAARNGKHAFHESFDMIKAKHSVLKFMIPENLQIFGEWLYAKHSIQYTDLRGYFQTFAVFDMEKQLWLSWNDVEEMTKLVGLIPVPVLGTFRFSTEKQLKSKLTEMAEKVIADGNEGIVVRNACCFKHKKFAENIAKYVREGHIQTDENWMRQAIVRNQLK